MRPLIASAATILLGAGEGFAAKITVEFNTESAEPITVVFDQEAGTYSDDRGVTGTYTFDAETGILCGTPSTGDGKLCATFEDAQQKVGHTSPYRATNGVSGTVTVKAIE